MAKAGLIHLEEALNALFNGVGAGAGGFGFHVFSENSFELDLVVTLATEIEVLLNVVQRRGRRGFIQVLV